LRFFLQLSIHYSPEGQHGHPTPAAAAAAAAARSLAMTEGTAGHDAPQVSSSGSSSNGKLHDIKQFFR
jgi:hypothetical protein